MITYPVIFFGASGPLREDFEDYSVGSLSGYAQGWQYNDHQWLISRSTSRYTAYTWKDYGVSGAFDDWDSYSAGSISLGDTSNLYGQGNFDIRPWYGGFSSPYFRDSQGKFTSADRVTGYSYINFNWSTNPPLDGYKSDFWSSKYIGKLTLPISGTYRLYVLRDQATRIYAGKEGGPSTLIFDQWGSAVTNTLEPASTFTYDSGQMDLLIHFYEDAGDAFLRLYWQKPAVPGGSPTGPITIILPDDFGITGYIRNFATNGPFLDYGLNSIQTHGNYITGYVWADKDRDYSTNHVVVSGNYSYGIVTIDGGEDYAHNSINPSGAYIGAYVYNVEQDYGRNVIQNHGFYAYKNAFSYDRDYATTYANAAGYHVVGFVTGDDRDYARQNTNLAGHHITGWVYPKDERDYAFGYLTTDGYYAGRFVYPREQDYAYNTIDPYGIYLPRFVYSQDVDHARNSINPAGYYITGYHNYDDRDHAKNEINPAGYRVYHQVTGDAFRDYSTNQANLAGSYSFGIAYMSGIKDLGYNYLGFVDSYYRNVYVYAREAEPAYSVLSMHGYNIYRYVPANYMNAGYGSIDANGNYFYRFVYNSEAEPAYSIINPNGYYVPSYPYSNEAEPAYNILSVLGEFYYAKVPTREAEPAYNILGLTDGVYFSRFVYPDRPIDFCRNILHIDGEYSRQAPETLSDTSTLTASWSGSYTTQTVDTLDYWIGLYETSIYDNVKTKQYFFL